MNGKEYIQNVATSTAFATGQIIKIKYNPNEPNDFSYNEISSQYMGLGISSFMILILSSIVVKFYLTMTYKPYAALTGTGAAANMIGNAFR